MNKDFKDFKDFKVLLGKDIKVNKANKDRVFKDLLDQPD